MDENQITNKTEDTALNAVSDDNVKQTSSPLGTTEDHTTEASDTQETASTTAATPINSAFEVKNSAASSPVTYYSAPEHTTSTDSTSTNSTTNTSNTHTETPKPAVNSDFYTNSYSNTATETSNGFAIASLVMGILGILTSCCCGLGTLFCVLGIIFGCIQQKDENGNKPGMAIAGLITSGIGILLGALTIVYIILIGAPSM